MNARGGAGGALTDFFGSLQGRHSAIELDALVTAIATRTSQTAEPSFVGVSDWSGRHVWIERGDDVRRLRYRGEQLVDGFAWGHYGYSARELARSILHEVTESAVLAELRCRDFAREVVAQLPADAFRLSHDDVRAWIEHDRIPVATRD